MSVKFARLDYVKTHDEIPVKFNVIKQNVESNLSWYIDRYNPLVITECAIAGERGVKVLLPLTENESLVDVERTKKIILRAMDSLRANDVEIVLPPENIIIEQRNGVSVATGRRLFSFFMCKAIQRWSNLARRDLKRCETVIINDNLELTESILDHICENLNFVTVMDLSGDKEWIMEKADKIFDDTGLNIVVRGKNKAALKTADVVINTSISEFDTAYKRGAVVFDLSADIERRRNLIERRPDILVIDGLVLNYKNTAIPLTMFELALYLKNRHFRNIVMKGYDMETGAALCRAIKRMELDIYSFTQVGKIIRNGEIMK